MKKQFLNLSAIVIVAGAITVTGCKKEDKTAPVITLKGDASKTIYIGDTYTDEGATAEDDRDGDISANIVKGGSVDNTKAAVYTLTYDVTDKAGNAATQVKRDVTVKIKNANVNGNYSVSESCTPQNYSGSPFNVGPYNGTVTAASSDLTTITFGNFGNFSGTTVNINGTISGNLGTTVTLASTTIAGGSFSGDGTIQNDAKKITITYDVTISGKTDRCTATWTKQ
jgi:hypothetical protein